jgi:hypothetical protein
MLETIRQFAEEQLAAGGQASEVRAAHARYFAGRERTSWPCGTALASGKPTTGSSSSCPNLRTAFRWAADQGDLHVASAIATYVGLLGAMVQSYEPIAWTKELIDAARAVDHPGLGFLYVIASLCYTTGRIEAAVHYSEAGQIVLVKSHDALPGGFEFLLGAVSGYRPARTDGRVVPRPARTPGRQPRPPTVVAGVCTVIRRV